MFTLDQFRPLVQGSTSERMKVIVTFIFWLSIGVLSISAMLFALELILSYSAKLLNGFASDPALYAMLAITEHSWASALTFALGAILAFCAMAYKVKA